MIIFKNAGPLGPNHSRLNVAQPDKCGPVSGGGLFFTISSSATVESNSVILDIDQLKYLHTKIGLFLGIKPPVKDLCIIGNEF